MDLQQAEDLFKQAIEAYKNNDLELAIQLWSQIEKSPDEVKEIYGKAQVNLGFLLNELKRFAEAEHAYKNVSREDSKKLYVTTQVNLGILLKQQQRFEEAEQAFKNVTREDSVEQYAKAQFNLGILLKQQQRFDEAEQAYKNVGREDSVEYYATAQVNLGFLLNELKRFNEAKQCYKNVSRLDSVEQYVKAQFNLGTLLQQHKRFQEAEQAYNNVSREDSLDIYTKTQNNLGGLLADLKRFDEAEKAYKNITQEDSVQHYAWAQWNLYWDCGQNKDHLIYIQKEHDLETYAQARFVLGELEENLSAKSEYWQQIPQESTQYKKESYQINVVKNISDLENSTYKNELFQVFQKVGEVLQALFINNKYEQSIAHYTTLSVSKLLLCSQKEKPNNFEPKSKLRLNTINLMNDPEEGLLINKLLCLDAKITTEDSAFIACFTLHHDSLNQFRLYGKENKEEASGLSLVLDKEFFSIEHNAARIYQKEVSMSERIESDNEKRNSLAAMPLYRCIYFDPTSGLIKVAQREEWSFKREFKLEDEHDWYAVNENAEENWKEYLNDPKNHMGIIQIENKVREGLESLSKKIQSIEHKKFNDQEQEILAEILLPLRYLMKHMAFKEEQECRMIYVTQMDNPLIKYDEKINRIYIDYEPSVMQHLEKIYLAPKAKGEKMVFEYLCSRGQEARQAKAPVKVKISQNPFQ